MGTSGVSRRFVLAGVAVFTVKSSSGEHFTFRVQKVDPSEEYPNTVWFASVLTGPNNEHDYTYVGRVSASDLSVFPTRKSAYKPDSKVFRSLQWSLRVIDGKQDLPEGYSISSAGLCARCGRTLTTPKSIEEGFGPECSKRA